MIAILILPLLLLYMKSRVWGEHLSRPRRQSRRGSTKYESCGRCNDLELRIGIWSFRIWDNLGLGLELGCCRYPKSPNSFAWSCQEVVQNPS